MPQHPGKRDIRPLVPHAPSYGYQYQAGTSTAIPDIFARSSANTALMRGVPQRRRPNRGTNDITLDSWGRILANEMGAAQRRRARGGVPQPPSPPGMSPEMSRGRTTPRNIQQAPQRGAIGGMPGTPQVGGAARFAEEAPFYFEGDELKPAAWPPERIGRLQRQMVDAGVLRGEFRLGVWDPPSVAAYTELLAFANASGTRVSEAMQRYADAEQMGGPQFIRTPFLPEDYMRPDPARLRADVQGLFRQALGRDATDREVKNFSRMLADADRESYRANVNMARSAHRRSEDAREAMFEAELGMAMDPFHDDIPPVPVEVEAGEIQGVDPMARVIDSFENQYRSEREWMQREEQRDEASANFLRGVSRMDALIAGGG